MSSSTLTKLNFCSFSSRNWLFIKRDTHGTSLTHKVSLDSSFLFIFHWISHQVHHFTLSHCHFLAIDRPYNFLPGLALFLSHHTSPPPHKESDHYKNQTTVVSLGSIKSVMLLSHHRFFQVKISGAWVNLI